MDAKAIKLINMVLKHEGNWCKVDGDSGCETYQGISRKFHPNWDGWKIIDANKPLKYNQKIKDEELEKNVRMFYYEKYYTPMKIHKLDNLLIAGHTFCHGVNCGCKTTIKILQRSINKACGVKISVDGVIGNQTLQYANSDKQNEIAQEFINQRNTYYNNIIKNKPSQKKFLKGWLNRVKSTTKVCSSSSVLLTSIGKGDNSILNTILSFIYDLIKLFVKK